MSEILGQFCINVTDIERSVRFWEETVGIPLQHRTEIDQAYEAVLQADAGGSRLQLAQQKNQAGPIDMGDAMWKIYVNTADCQAVYDRCMQAGCESITEPTRLDRWPVTVAFVKDPDGYLIEFVERHEGTRPGVPDPKSG
jgi:lactoylglutathione lyase